MNYEREELIQMAREEIRRIEMSEKTEVIVKRKRRLSIWEYTIITTCSVCGGEMERTNITYTVDPPLYEYKCKQCQRTAVIKAGVLGGDDE